MPLSQAGMKTSVFFAPVVTSVATHKAGKNPQATNQRYRYLVDLENTPRCNLLSPMGGATLSLRLKIMLRRPSGRPPLASLEWYSHLLLQ
jgi:hypothetical protein